MVAAFAAAYMSTIATQLNWGASYIVNDFYRRFLQPAESDQHYVRVSQLATVGITLVSAIVTYNMDSISGAWQLLISIGAGTGGVLLLRWYWWRINAWSEISAMLAASVVSLSLSHIFGFNNDKPEEFAWSMIITVGLTTAIWLAVTLLTPPESNATLVAFFRRTRPSLTGWKPIAAQAPEVRLDGDGMVNLLDWICGCILIYGTLFGVGKILLKEAALGFGMLAAAALAGFIIYRDLSNRGWNKVVD